MKKGLIEVQVPFNAKDQHFQNPKPPGTFRIFCLGGSSTYGLGFQERSAFPERLGAMLASQDNSRRIEVFNLGVLAFSSDGVLGILKQTLDYEPDLIIVYTGHNEMTWLFTYNQVSHPFIYRAWSFMLEKSRAFNAMLFLKYFLIGRHLQIPAEQLMFQEDDLSPQFPPERRKVVVENFALNLEQIARLCKEKQTPLVMTTIISNDSEFYPIKSLFSRSLKESDRQHYREQLQSSALLLGEGKFKQSKTILDHLIEKDSGYALARFLRGRALIAMGQFDSARDDFVLARDLDDFPARGPSVINMTIRETCRREGVPILDLEKKLREQSPHNLIGFNLCFDYLHHNLFCQQLIAEEITRFLNQHDLLPPDLRTPDPLPNLEQVNLKLAVTKEYLATRYFYIAFLFGFEDARTFYLEYAQKMLELSELPSPKNLFPQLATGVLRLRRNDPAGCRAKWEPLLRRNSTEFFSKAEYFYSHWIRIIDNLILFERSSINLVPFNALHGSLIKDLQTSPGRSRLEIPEDPCFLGRFRYAFEWDAESGILSDESQTLADLLEERKRIVNETQPGNSSPIIIRNFFTENCAKADKPLSFISLNQDPQLIFRSASLNPLLVHSLQIDLEYMPPAGSNQNEFDAALYWATESHPEFSEQKKVAFKIKTDGRRHSYEIPVANRWQWIKSDTITRLRLDPTDQPGTEFVLHHLKIIPIKNL